MVTQENISFVISAVTTGLYMGGIIILVMGLFTAYWRLSSHFGRPWGVLITRLAPLPKDGNSSSERGSTSHPRTESYRSAEQTGLSDRTQLEGTLAGMVGVFLWIAAAGVETAKTTIPNISEPWSMQPLLVLSLRSALEGFIATLVSGAAIRLVGGA